MNAIIESHAAIFVFTLMFVAVWAGVATVAYFNEKDAREAAERWLEERDRAAIILMNDHRPKRPLPHIVPNDAA